MKTQIFFITALILLLATNSCEKSDDIIPKEIDLDLKSKQLVEADNEFGIDIFKKILTEEDENFTISPLSISLALAMTYNGAEGETKTAMEEAMRLSGLTTDEINQSYQSLVAALLEVDPKVTLETAQSIWYRMGYNVLDSFKEVNETYYDAEVNELDFGRSDAKDIINGWIEDKTHDKIKNMISEVNNQYVMFLINAIYFNGEWSHKFDKKDTYKGSFFQEDGNIIEVDIMAKTDSVNYQSNELFSAIEMPYGQGNFNMVVLLPNGDKTCNDIAGELTPESWKQWMDAFNPVSELEIMFPKFKAEYKIKLNDILSYMGMGIAFGGGADFSGINGYGGIWIDYVQHNTFIDVSEKGTEAAAATVVAMLETAMPSSPQFHANRPFIYAITEKETGAILFVGRINEPTYK
ncbi:MAG: serpin family protein [Prolixibacteraceae bacterium]|nr:serpin family protein [Prolixibacteraceae bacterium]